MIMELVYRQEHKQSLVTFGEPLNKAVPKDFAVQRHVIILTSTGISVVTSFIVTICKNFRTSWLS